MSALRLPGSPVELRGAAWLEETADGLLPHRLPSWTRDQFPDGLVAHRDAQPSGVRLCFSSAGERVVLHLAVARDRVSPGPPPVGADFDVLLDGDLVHSGPAGEGGLAGIDPIAGTVTTRVGEGTTLDVDLPPNPAGAARQVEIWFPATETVWIRGLESDAGIDAPAPQEQPRWVHYGSSISQGANAASPTGIWPIVAARRAGLDLVDLSLSTPTLLVPFVARAIRDQPADIVSFEVGSGLLADGPEGRRMHVPLLHGFLDTIREAHPTTPVVIVAPAVASAVVSAVSPPKGEPEYARQVREVVRARREAGDAALHHVDGRSWSGPGGPDQPVTGA